MLVKSLNYTALKEPQDICSIPALHMLPGLRLGPPGSSLSPAYLPCHSLFVSLVQPFYKFIYFDWSHS